MPNADGTATAEEAAAAAAGNDKPWYETLDPDLKANPSVQKFKDVGSLTKSYLELEKTLGKEKVVIPTDKSTKEEITAFWRKLGAPEKEDGYELHDEDVAEPVRLSAEDKKAFQKAAFEMGVPKKHVEGLFQIFKQMREQKFNQETERVKNMKGATEAALRGKHGAAYEAKVAGAQRVLDTLGKGKTFSKEAQQMILNDQGFLEMMAEVYEMVGEDKFGGKARTTLTPEEAQRELNEIMGNKKGPFYDALHPEHEAVVDKAATLQALILAGQAE